MDDGRPRADEKPITDRSDGSARRRDDDSVADGQQHDSAAKAAPTSPASGSTNILRSAFFAPSIIDAFLSATLTDPRFPTSALRWLMLPDAGLEAKQGDDGVKEIEMRIDALLHNDTGGQRSSLALTSDQAGALQDAIRALCTHLALPDEQTVLHSDSPVIESVQRRCMLGFCRLLARQTVESAVEFDVVRQALFSRRRKGGTKQKEGPASGSANGSAISEETALYLSALWGAELAAEMQGRRSEAERFRLWRRKAMLL